MRFYLTVPFNEKEEAKALGCLWDPHQKQWYLSAENPEIIARWPIERSELPAEFSGENRAFGGNELYVDLVPQSCWFTNVRTCIAKNDWNRLRRYIYNRANYLCECCGEKAPLEAHERWDFNEGTKIQKLVRVIALCKLCHEVTHMGLAQIRGRGEIAFRHLMKVTKMNELEAQLHIDEAFSLWEKRSQFHWLLDISLITNAGIKLTREFNLKERAIISQIQFIYE
ncbi:DUF5710 domain-containing protein [Legionella gresilensis]|uniref:DUF5710 domain-containing protein n=1 Tax=Legionella gresilensis TaxID=91823 RepID=UPI0010416224|nr:DUF5710 domain-containing protein [Legionella gresilensis]